MWCCTARANKNHARRSFLPLWPAFCMPPTQRGSNLFPFQTNAALPFFCGRSAPINRTVVPPLPLLPLSRARARARLGLACMGGDVGGGNASRLPKARSKHAPLTSITTCVCIPEQKGPACRGGAHAHGQQTKYNTRFFPPQKQQQQDCCVLLL